LGLPDDRPTYCTFASPGHRCFTEKRPSEIELAFQARYCLTSMHPLCSRYVAATGQVRAATRTTSADPEPSSGLEPTAALASAAETVPSLELVAAPEMEPAALTSELETVSPDV